MIPAPYYRKTSLLEHGVIDLLLLRVWTLQALKNWGRP